MNIKHQLQLASQRLQAGDIDQAKCHCESVLQQFPDHPYANFFLGFIYQKQDVWVSAAACYQRAIRRKPDYIEAINNLGGVYQQQGRLDLALECYQKLVDLQPENPHGYYNLGLIYEKRSQTDQALALYEKVRSLQDSPLVAHYKAGEIYQQKGQLVQALEAYQVVLQKQPNHSDARFKLGLIYQEQEQFSKAIATYRELIQRHPNFAAAHNNLGMVLRKQGQLAEAIAAYERALALNPNFAATFNNLGNALKEQGKLEAAIAAYRRALNLNPDYTVAHSNLLFSLNYCSDYEPSDLYQAHQQWAVRQITPTIPVIQQYTNRPDPARCLRIGYVSGDLKTHSVTYFLEPLLAACDRHRFEVICYANNQRTDATTERLQGLVHRWHNIVALGDEQVVQLIQQDAIDILVDLSGHTRGNRLRVFARKPAPVQVSYIGYPNTTGLNTMDYRFTDEWADPEGETDSLHTEELIRLPHGFLCYQPPWDAPNVDALPVLRAGHITFGSFNNLAKVSPPLIAHWSAILRAVPDSRLLLKARPLADANTCDDIRGVFADQGITADRLDLLGRIPAQAEHLNLYNQIDIALDTFPYNGTTTTCEALWMGVPVITQAGQTHAARVGVSLLRAVGLPELIATSTEDYIHKAISLAENPARLQRLRQTLRDRMQQCPLTNADLITQSVENAYRTLWRNWCDNP